MNNKLKSAITLVVLVMALAGTALSKTGRVNNNTGVTGTDVYNTFATAYAASVDTFIFEGSNTTYGDLTIARKVVIFGPGYHLTQNPQTQANLLTVTIGNISFNTGSDGSVVSGCKINKITVNANNITIARNYITNSAMTEASILLNGNTTNTIIQQNIIIGLITNTDNKNPTSIIRNNLLGRVFFTSTVGPSQIYNNTFSGSIYCANSASGYQTYAIDVYNASIYNNIINRAYYTYSYNGYWAGELKYLDTQANTIFNNILNQPNPGSYSGTNDQYDVNMATVFAVGTGDIDKNYIITAGSVAETGAQDGGECGMFGGSFKYVLSGLPPIPHIYKLDADPAGNNSDPLTVKISVKSQN